MALIKDRKPAADSWKLLETLEVGEDGSLPPLPDGGLIVPLAAWRCGRAGLLERGGPLGVWLAGEHDPAEIAPDLDRLQVVAVHFKTVADGRGYSIGQLLRRRYGWNGELRAIGEVRRDMLFYLARCGFDAFSLRDGDDIAIALTAFGDFSDGYQASVEQPLPLFRRREAASA
jgi:uncharacterized protein (DUF934 family)